MQTRPCASFSHRPVAALHLVPVVHDDRPAELRELQAERAALMALHEVPRSAIDDEDIIAEMDEQGRLLAVEITPGFKVEAHEMRADQLRCWVQLAEWERLTMSLGCDISEDVILEDKHSPFASWIVRRDVCGGRFAIQVQRNRRFRAGAGGDVEVTRWLTSGADLLATLSGWGADTERLIDAIDDADLDAFEDAGQVWDAVCGRR